MDKNKRVIGKKGGVETEKMINWAIFIAVLILVIIIIGVLVLKGTSYADYIKNLLRFK